MKSLAALTLILLASCSQKKAEVSVVDREIFEEFQSVMVGGDFEKLAERLDPEVLREFRRRLEFTTEHPLEGSWFTGTRDRPPTPEELLAVSDSQFFTIYLKGTAEVIGNPFGERYSGKNLVAATKGSKVYRHFVFTKDDEYDTFAVTFSFKQSGDGWHLVEPSVVTKFAGQLRAANGGIADGVLTASEIISECYKGGSHHDGDRQLATAFALITSESDPIPALRRMMAEEIPERRAFAAITAGLIGDARFEVDLQKLRGDKAALGKFSGDWFWDTVGDAAEEALKDLKEGGLAKLLDEGDIPESWLHRLSE